MKEIILTTINAKWIHPSLALRLLKANLGNLENRCEIIEFALRQPLAEKIEGIIAARPRILGISVSIWNHSATIELLRELKKIEYPAIKPAIVLGGPEVSHLPADAEIFSYADYVIRGEGETAFRVLCEKLLAERRTQGGQEESADLQRSKPQFINAENADVSKIKSAYHLYTDEDLEKKLIYVEAGRGCPFNCEFCLSAVKETEGSTVREFPLEPFLAQMDMLIRRGAKTFKFLDRSFNVNIKRAVRICEFFLEKITEKQEAERQATGDSPAAIDNFVREAGMVIHFEMVPSLFPPQLREVLIRFPPGTLRIETGIQTLNGEVAARIGLPGGQNRYSNPEKKLEALRFLLEKTNAIIHVDLIAGLPGEDLASFAKGFDALLHTLAAWMPPVAGSEKLHGRGFSVEIQLGILKLLPGAPIARHNENFGMRYNPLPPYEVEETSAMSAGDIRRIKNFARFWEIIINRRLMPLSKISFDRFMELSDSLFARFGRNWGIDKNELKEAVESLTVNR